MLYFQVRSAVPIHPLIVMSYGCIARETFLFAVGELSGI